MEINSEHTQFWHELFTLLFVFGLNPNETSAISFHSLAKLKMVKLNRVRLKRSGEKNKRIHCIRTRRVVDTQRRRIYVLVSISIYTGSDAIYRLTVFCCIFPYPHHSIVLFIWWQPAPWHSISILYAIYLWSASRRNRICSYFLFFHTFIWPSEK